MIPDHLLTAPAVDMGRYSAAQRARALASLAPLPRMWRPKADARMDGGQGVGNILLALKHRVGDEIAESRASIKVLTRQTLTLRRHLERLKRAEQLSED